MFQVPTQQGFPNPSFLYSLYSGHTGPTADCKLDRPVTAALAISAQCSVPAHTFWTVLSPSLGLHSSSSETFPDYPHLASQIVPTPSASFLPSFSFTWHSTYFTSISIPHYYNVSFVKIKIFGLFCSLLYFQHFKKCLNITLSQKPLLNKCGESANNPTQGNQSEYMDVQMSNLTSN